MFEKVLWVFVFCRSSLDSSTLPSKRKAQTEREDTEEDVEEQKVRNHMLVNVKNLQGWNTSYYLKYFILFVLYIVNDDDIKYDM